MISNMYSYITLHGFSVRSRKGGAREDDESVSTGCDAAVTYARDSFCGFPFVLSRGGGGGGGRHTGTRLTWVYSFLL